MTQQRSSKTVRKVTVYLLLYILLLQRHEILAELNKQTMPLATWEMPQTNEEKATALFRSAAKGQFAIIKKLLDSGVDPNSQDNTGETALDLAAGEGHLAIVKYLVG